MKHRPARIPSPILSPVSSRQSQISLANSHLTDSTAPTSHRWSEIVPPKNALTFAAVWDPEDGIIAFSAGADLFEEEDGFSDQKSLDSPSDACDGRSQVLTIGQSTIPLTETENNTATLAFFRDTHQYLFAAAAARMGSDEHEIGGCTRTSSTMGTLDVYLRGSLFGKAHGGRRHFSCLDDLDRAFEFDPESDFAVWSKQFMMLERRGGDVESEGGMDVEVDRDSDSITDEGFFEAQQARRYSEDGVLVDLNLSSSFSTTTTSTSNYISVEPDDEDFDFDVATGTWSTLEAPTTPNFARLTFRNSVRHSQKLKKRRRPYPPPARPSEVLQREEYNHATSSPTSPRGSLDSMCSININIPPVLPKFVKGLSKWKRRTLGDGDDQWVRVDVRHEITQHYDYI